MIKLLSNNFQKKPYAFFPDRNIQSYCIRHNHKISVGIGYADADPGSRPDEMETRLRILTTFFSGRGRGPNSDRGGGSDRGLHSRIPLPEFRSPKFFFPKFQIFSCILLSLFCKTIIFIQISSQFTYSPKVYLCGFPFQPIDNFYFLLQSTV